jgi:membrane protein YqaA with SNARE-associated domain
MEWVASGQVIQFTTVMILLSALMALGLTQILTEQTLGTLLGGLAGYVLAQGVGRATARATLNATNAANAANAQSSRQPAPTTTPGP